jgi:hypothetical protein
MGSPGDDKYPFEEYPFGILGGLVRGACTSLREPSADLPSAVNCRTAMRHFTNYLHSAGRIKVDEWLKLSRPHKLPYFIDAAADRPPISRLWEYVQMGYDRVTFSGGKHRRRVADVLRTPMIAS